MANDPQLSTSGRSSTRQEHTQPRLRCISFRFRLSPSAMACAPLALILLPARQGWGGGVWEGDRPPTHPPATWNSTADWAAGRWQPHTSAPPCPRQAPIQMDGPPDSKIPSQDYSNVAVYQSMFVTWVRVKAILYLRIGLEVGVWSLNCKKKP